MFSRFRKPGATFIAKNRRSKAVRAVHALAKFVDDSYQNADLDSSTNGESDVICRLSAADFRTAFDVGTHVGDWSIEALHRWPGVHVHAFEVVSETFGRLARRINDADLASRTSLNPVGLSDTTGRQRMYFFPQHTDLTCDRPRHEGQECVTFDGEVMRGDEYVERHGVDHVDFLKIDVEGAEYKVLRGLARTVASEKIHCIQFEYGAFSTQTRFLVADYYEMLSKGYWIGKIYPSYVEFKDYVWTVEDFRFVNFLCVSRARPDLKLMLAG